MNDIGSIAVGQRADLAVWDVADLDDVHDVIAGLVLGPDRRARALYVGGNTVVDNGELVGSDPRAARSALALRARRLWT